MKKQQCLLAITLLAFIAGCNIQPRVSDGKQLFLLDVVRRAEQSPETIDATLKIRPCRVSEPFGGRSLIYRTGSVQYEQDHYNLFLTSPDEQLTGIFRVWFQDSGLFRSVETQILSAEYTLESHVDKLYADFQNNAVPIAVMQMHAMLSKYDKSCSCTKVVLDKTFIAKSPMLTNPTAADVVEAFGICINQILKDLETEITAVQE